MEMEMTKVFESLKKLQDILKQKYSVQAKIKEAPERFRAQEELLARSRKSFIEQNSQYEAIKQKINEIQNQLEEAVSLREAGEKGMDDISTHREYEALEKQISEATAREESFRKDLKAEERRFADLSEKIKEDEEWILSQESELNEARASLDKETNGLKKELAALEKKAASITPSLDAEIVYKFQRIIQRNAEGVVPVKGGVCNGCHMILPAQFANEVRDGEKILFCPYCSRILFYQESNNEEDGFTLNDAEMFSDSDDEFEEEDDEIEEFESEEDDLDEEMKDDEE